MTELDRAQRIAETLERWIAASPGRSVDVRETPDGWRATMTEERSMGGSSLIDCLSQAAVVASVENEETGT